MPRSDLEEALLNVRRAYRLLQRYQRRVLDLTAELARVIDEDSTFQLWRPTHYQPNPYKGKNPAGRWAWDGLPYYDFCAFFCRDEFWKSEHAPGDWMLVIRCTADTGFENLGMSEPDPLGFKSVDEAGSLMRVYFYQYKREKVEGWIEGAFGWRDCAP